MKTLTKILFCFFTNVLFCQNLFVNGGLNGTVANAVAPPGWTIIPSSSPVVTPGLINYSPDVCDINGPNLQKSGVPFEGVSFVSAGYSFISTSACEGINQMVNGLIVGNTYTISFFQAVNMTNLWTSVTGMWRVYIDNTLVNTSSPTTSTISSTNLNLQWEFRSFTFVATSTSHLFQFVPFDNINANVYMSLDAASLTMTNALPIELVSFKASVTSDRQVVLEWQTATETNNDYFVVERSSNFEDWTFVAKVDGAGDSEELLNYTARDLDPLTGISFYRLKQVDEDGQVTYSDVRSVKLGIDLGDELLTVFPNPATTEFTVYGDRLFPENFSLFNNLGESVPLNIKASNDDMIVYSIEGMENGVYILNYNTGMEVIHKKVFVEK